VRLQAVASLERCGRGRHRDSYEGIERRGFVKRGSRF
jgi:hypothetical protein